MDISAKVWRHTGEKWSRQSEEMPLHRDAMTVEVCRSNPLIDDDIQLFYQALSTDDELISERLAALARILKEMEY